MAKREWTDAERKAFGDKMRAARRQKNVTEVKDEPQLQEEAQTSQTQGSSPKQITLDEDKFNQLMERLSKLEGSKTESSTSDTGFDQFGKPTGVIQRYSLDPSHYISPVARLLVIPELQRYAVADNYEITWNVDQTVYETKYGTSMADPKFTLVLKKKIYDDKGELTDRRILVQTGVFFEDPAASVQEALQLGLPIDKANTPEFLDQMRFLRYKQWLMDIFNPQLPRTTKARITDQVIDGKAYQIEDYSVVI